ncbi:MAG: hypothetical protein WBD74_01680 [Candidatus Aquilonibacter sp.]
MSVVEGPTKLRRWAIGATIAISVLPWLYFVVGVLPARGLALEGAYFLGGLLGALSFCVTGPLASIVTRSLREYWALSVATLSYQSICLSSSIMPIFFRGGFWTSRNSWILSVYGALIGVAWYVFVYLIVRVAGKSKPPAEAARAVLLVIASLGLILVLIARS